MKCGAGTQDAGLCMGGQTDNASDVTEEYTKGSTQPEETFEFKNYLRKRRDI